MLALSTILWGCGSPETTTAPFTAGCEAGAIDVWGIYDGVTDACILNDTLETACGDLWNWWRGEGCPSLETYVRATRPRGYAYTGTIPWGGNQFQSYSAVRCVSTGGQPVDVVTATHSTGDEVYATRVVFGASGVVWVQDGHYFTQPGHEFCCQPNGHPTFYSAWGNPIRYDCTNASVYTPADFPDSADTGGSPSSTGDTGNPGDTSDTGVCR